MEKAPCRVEGSTLVSVTTVTSRLVGIILYLFCLSYQDGPLVTVAIATRPAVSDWMAHGRPLEVISRSCGRTTGPTGQPGVVGDGLGTGHAGSCSSGAGPLAAPRGARA